MPEFDAERFLYALAGRLSAGAWELAALRKVLREVPLNYPRIVSQLPLKLLAASKSCPDYYQLVELLRADASLSRILKRGSAITGARQPRRGKLRFPRREGLESWVCRRFPMRLSWRHGWA